MRCGQRSARLIGVPGPETQTLRRAHWKETVLITVGFKGVGIRYEEIPYPINNLAAFLPLWARGELAGLLLHQERADQSAKRIGSTETAVGQENSLTEAGCLERTAESELRASIVDPSLLRSEEHTSELQSR